MYTIQPANQSFLSNLFFRHSFLIIFYYFFQINYILIVHDNVHSAHKKRLPPQRFSIVKATDHFYFYYMMSGAKALSPTYEQAHVDLDIFTLVSLYCLKLKLSSDKINQKICCFLNTKYTAVNHDIFMLRVRWKEAGIMHMIVISCLIY